MPTYEKQIKDTVIRLTIGSITDVLRVYKLDDATTLRDIGYNQGIDDAIKAVQLFLKVLEKDQEDDTNE
jgi:uncharacterized protein (DUF2164 family)